MQTSRILWLIWCGAWCMLWTIGAFLMLGFNPIFDLMALISLALMLAPVGKTSNRPDSHDGPHQRLDGSWSQR